MPISPFSLDQIFNWQGYLPLQAGFERLGYKCQTFHNDRMRRICESMDSLDEFELYQMELAREALSSQGMDDYRGAHRKRAGFYKSVYIDNLERKVGKNYKEGRRSFALHPCIVAHEEYLVALCQPGKVEYAKYTMDRLLLKQEEFDRKNLSSDLWDDTYKGFAPTLSAAAMSLGFEKGRGRTCYNSDIAPARFYKHSPSGIRFNVGFSTNGGRSLYGVLPFVFWVDFTSSLPGQRPVTLMEVILPGISEYLVYSAHCTDKYPENYVEMTARAGTLGVWAAMEAYNLLIEGL